MATTFAQLKTMVARDLRDPINETFTDAEVGDMVNAGIVEMGRLSPLKFRESITPIADTLAYTLQVATFGSGGDHRVNVHRVEKWDATPTPDRFVALLAPAKSEYVNTSLAGWELYNGVLYLTNAQEAAISSGQYLIVWGDRPYVQLVSDSDNTDLYSDGILAMREFAAARAYERLISDRALFQQWQTQPDNTDIPFTGLLSLWNSWNQRWRARRRELTDLQGPI